MGNIVNLSKDLTDNDNGNKSFPLYNTTINFSEQQLMFINTYSDMLTQLKALCDIVPPNKPCQKSRSIFSVGRIEKGTDLVRI